LKILKKIFSRYFSILTNSRIKFKFFRTSRNYKYQNG